MEPTPRGDDMSSGQPVASQRGRWWNGGASQRVRSNGLHFLGSAWRQISRTSKVILITSTLLVFVQIAATIAVLVVARNETCDKPLDLYLIVYIVRVAVASPFLVYQHLRRPRRLRQQQRPVRPPPESNNNNNSTAETSPSTSAIPSSSPPPTTTTNESAREANNNASNNNNNNNAAIINHRANLQAEWMDRVKSLLDLFAVLWFIVGNYFLFTSNDCARLAPALFYTTLVWVLLGYLLILIPLFLCASVIFCLPCVLMALRALNIGDVPGMTGGTKEEVRAIPVYRFKQEQADGAPGGQRNDEAQVRTSEPQIQQIGLFRRTFGKFYRLKKGDDIERNYPSITITPAQDAVCSICLSEYEDGDLLCKLWCEHHFHRDCVQEWLILNSKCPLCKRDFRGKQYQEDDEEEED